MASLPKKVFSSQPDSTPPDLEEKPVYVSGSDGIVRDTNTGLEWKTGPDKDTNWNEAKVWVESLGNGWRMPKTYELEGLYKKGIGIRNMTPLLKTTGWCIWSSETKGSRFERRFYLDFKTNSWYSHNADFSSQIRAFAVRSSNDIKTTSLTKPKAEKISSVNQKTKTQKYESGNRFTSDNNGTVLDNRTKLMWASSDAGTASFSHVDAKKYCEDYRGGGYTDWRMPTLDELKTLYNKNLSNNHGYHTTKSIDIGTDYIWADNSLFGGEAAFNFQSGSTASGAYVNTAYIRSTARALPVRDPKSVNSKIQSPPKVKPTGTTVSSNKKVEPTKSKKISTAAIAPEKLPGQVEETSHQGRFIAYSNGTVLDTQTNLMWARKDNGKGLMQHDVNDYIKNFAVGGFEDWRLPTMEELETIYDDKFENEYGCHINELISITDSVVWGSEGWGKIWALDFKEGCPAHGGKTGSIWYRAFNSGVARVLPVRDTE